MSRTLQFLIAAACVVIIACGAIYLVDRKKLSDQAAAERERAEVKRQIELEILSRRQRDNEQAAVNACAEALTAYDERGETFAFVQRAIAKGKPLTGDTMLAEVAACRDLIQSSKPSE